ncbi:hypothetical protein [Megasphaera hominis]|jgi:hypothetical protein|uniref:Uncharacterized protein n=1 Tax=Megasphaera hominis TaxID=159836 RepID=A0ABR6VIR6_9FIRM|nr:hypothetical protein [Megasphaera hominis]MBC3536978.1 hypothetical protein [Megasphaera hominis]
MTLGLFWSRYELELHGQHLREIDAKYEYLIQYEMWNWLIAKIPEKVQIQILRGHNHGEQSWSCHDWVIHMLEWLKENKSAEVYDAVIDKISIVKAQPREEAERHAARTLSDSELAAMQAAGYFKGIERRTKGEEKP